MIGIVHKRKGISGYGHILLPDGSRRALFRIRFSQQLCGKIRSRIPKVLASGSLLFR
jgi:hypothetical protein